jgi:hypothetical protein
MQTITLYTVASSGSSVRSMAAAAAVGWVIDKDDARRALPFDSIESAEDYCRDNPGTKVYEVVATIDLSTMTQVYPTKEPPT